MVDLDLQVPHTSSRLSAGLGRPVVLGGRRCASLCLAELLYAYGLRSLPEEGVTPMPVLRGSF